MNTLDADIRQLIFESVDEVEKKDWVGLVVGNQAQDFCIGANLKAGLVGQDANALEQAVRGMQDAFMRLRFCSKPVVTAPAGRTLGGGVEVAMAGSAMVPAAETHMGLVEVSVGIVPGAGGCKELVRRVVSPAMRVANSDPVPFLQQVLQTIAMAKVSTSGEEARSFGFVGASDRIVMNRDYQLSEAKKLVIELSANGYAPPRKAKNCYAAGRDALAALRAGLYVMQQGEYMSEYDLFVANKVAYILCGGKLTSPQWVDEQYFLDLEREAFVTLCGEVKTQERIQYMLETGKPLRN
jgi:3-hydroxyacyl-CoA dehydrogenase